MPDDHAVSVNFDPVISPTAVRGARPSEMQQEPPTITQPPAGDGDGPTEALPGTPYGGGQSEQTDVGGGDDGTG